MEEYMLDELDYKILNLISNDTRISFLEVSRICNMSGAAVHQRVQRMILKGVITGSHFMLDFEKIGYTTTAYLCLKFANTTKIEMVIENFRKVHEILECYQIIDEYDLMVKIQAKDNSHLLNIVEKKIKPLGLVTSKTIVSYRECFNKQMQFD